MSLSPLMRVLSLCLLAVTAAGCADTADVADENAADLVLRGGRVVTVDSTMPEAQAIAIRGHTIVAVGSDEDMDAFIGANTELVELNGRLVIPGLIEGHAHYMGLGQAKMNLDLMDVANWDEVIGMVAAAARDIPTDAWIIGRGWHQEKWDRVPAETVEGVPLHASLDSISPDNPVLLTHASGHAAFANKRALDLAGVDRNTPNPEGGEIVKDADGNPTGLLRETAQGLVGRARAESESRRAGADRDADNRRAVELAAEESLSKGVTTFVDAGTGFETIDLYRQLESEGALPVRLYVMIRASNDELEQRLPDYLMEAEENDYLTVRAIKVSIDGALGSHGAWLLEPYEDMPSSTGLSLVTPASVERTAELALEHGFQLGVHAIGDRANREVLDIYERTFAANPDATDLRWRIEHAQHLHPDDIARFGELGVIPAVQGVHATSDAPWIPIRLGEQRAREGAYMWQDMMASGAIIANGTDAPVEDVNPIASIYSSISRLDNEGNVFYGEQSMSREDALKSYTLNNAYATFFEDRLGSITVGKLADIVVLSADIMTVPEPQIADAVADITIVGGEVRYRRQ